MPRTSIVAFPEILPVPRAEPARQAELRSPNVWLKRYCREEGLLGTFLPKPYLGLLGTGGPFRTGEACTGGMIFTRVKLVPNCCHVTLKRW